LDSGAETAASSDDGDAAIVLAGGPAGPEDLRRTRRHDGTLVLRACPSRAAFAAVQIV